MESTVSVKVTGMSFIIKGVACRPMPVSHIDDSGTDQSTGPQMPSIASDGHKLDEVAALPTDGHHHDLRGRSAHRRRSVSTAGPEDLIARVHARRRRSR